MEAGGQLLEGGVVNSWKGVVNSRTLWSANSPTASKASAPAL